MSRTAKASGRRTRERGPERKRELGKGLTARTDFMPSHHHESSEQAAIKRASPKLLPALAAPSTSTGQAPRRHDARKVSRRSTTASTPPRHRAAKSWVIDRTLRRLAFRRDGSTSILSLNVNSLFHS
jgi:hypothetical protein